VAGKLCFGKEYANAGAGQIRDSKAFCEGRVLAQAHGNKHDNPHEAGSEAFVAYDLGFDSIAKGDPKGCCAA